jgi:putative spermidine/putrescine transport system permease protein
MRLAALGLHALSWLVLAFLALPVLIVVPLSLSSVRFFRFPPPGWSLQWYVNFFTSREWLGALSTSFAVGLASMTLAMTLGTLAALVLARTAFRGKGLLMAAILSPLMLPTVIIGIALYFWLAPLRLVGTPAAVVLGHTVLGIPFVTLIVSAALERFDPNLERAALSLGAPPLRAFWYVTFPIIRPALLSAAFLAFLASFDELIVALFLSGPYTITLPIQMWRGIRFESDPTIAAVSTLFLFVSMLALLITQLGRGGAARRSASGSPPASSAPAALCAGEARQVHQNLKSHVRGQGARHAGGIARRAHFDDICGDDG